MCIRDRANAVVFKPPNSTLFGYRQIAKADSICAVSYTHLKITKDMVVGTLKSFDNNFRVSDYSKIKL